MNFLKPKVSSLTLSLLTLVKNPEADVSWQGLAKHLFPGQESTVEEVMTMMVSAYQELMDEPRFCMGGKSYMLPKLFLAPSKGANAVSKMSTSTDGRYTLEEVYESFIAYLVGEFRLAVVDWRRGL